MTKVLFAIAVVAAVFFMVWCLRPGSSFRAHLRALKTDPNSYHSLPGVGLVLRSMILLLMIGGSSLCMPALAAKGGKAYRLAHQAAPKEQYQVAPDAPPASVADRFGQLYVQHNGRIILMRNLAIEFCKQLYGTEGYKGLTPEQVLAGYYFNQAAWLHEQIQPFSKNDTVSMRKCRQLIAGAMDGSLFLLRPSAQPGGAWSTHPEALNRIAGYLEGNDAIGAFRAIELLRDDQIHFAQEDSLPSSRHSYGLEVLGNALYMHTFSLGVLIVGALLLLVFSRRLGKKKRLLGWHIPVIELLLIGVWGVLSFYLGLAWWLSGYAPLSSVSLALEVSGWIGLTMTWVLLLLLKNHPLRGIIGSSGLAVAGVLLCMAASISLIYHGSDQLPEVIAYKEMLMTLSLAVALFLGGMAIIWLCLLLLSLRRKSIRQVYKHLLIITLYPWAFMTGISILFVWGCMLA